MVKVDLVVLDEDEERRRNEETEKARKLALVPFVPSAKEVQDINRYIDR